MSKDKWTPVRTLNEVMIFINSAIWIALWIYAKFTRTSPDWLVNLGVDAVLCLLVLMHFSSPNWDYHALCLSLAITAVMIGTSHMKGQVAVCSFLFIVNAYDALGFPSILLPGSYKGSILIRQIINGVVASLGLWLVYGNTYKSRRAIPL